MNQNKEKALVVIEKYANGQFLGHALEDVGMSRSTFGRTLRLHPSLDAEYQRARETTADRFADEIVNISDNEPDPHKARIRVDARKWSAGVLNRALYGERSELTVNKGLDLSAVLTDVQARRLRLARDSEPIEEAQVIETASLPAPMPADTKSDNAQGDAADDDPFEGC